MKMQDLPALNEKHSEGKAEMSDSVWFTSSEFCILKSAVK